MKTVGRTDSRQWRFAADIGLKKEKKFPLFALEARVAGLNATGLPEA